MAMREQLADTLVVHMTREQMVAVYDRTRQKLAEKNITPKDDKAARIVLKYIAAAIAEYDMDFAE